MIDAPRKGLATFHGRELSWVRPHFFRREHVLMAGDTIVATMRFHGLHSATARSASGSWLIERKGFILIGATVRDLRSMGQVLTLSSGFRNRVIELADGRTYRWKPTGVFGLNVEIVDQHEIPLLRCKHSGPFSKRRGTLEIFPPGAKHPLLEPLAFTCWYLITRLRQRRASHGAG